MTQLGKTMQEVFEATEGLRVEEAKEEMMLMEVPEGIGSIGLDDGGMGLGIEMDDDINL